MQGKVGEFQKQYLFASFWSVLATTMFVYLAVIYSQAIRIGGAGFSGNIYLILYVPAVFIGVKAGIIADKNARKPILMSAQTAVILLISFLAFYVYRGLEIPRAILILVCLFVGVAFAFLGPIRFAMAGDYVEAEKIPTYTIFLTLFVVLSSILGPIIMGLLIQYFSWIGGFALVIISYVLSNIFLLRLPTISRSYENIEHDILKYVRSETAILGLLCLVIPTSYIFGSLQILSPYLAKSIYLLNEKQRGLFIAVTGIGFLVGGIVSIKIQSVVNYLKIATASIVATSVSVAATLILKNIYWSATCFFIANVFGSIALSGLVARLQDITSDKYRGGVMAIFATFQLVSMSVGAFVSGVGIDAEGVMFALVSSGVVSILLLIIMDKLNQLISS